MRRQRTTLSAWTSATKAGVMTPTRSAIRLGTRLGIGLAALLAAALAGPPDGRAQVPGASLSYVAVEPCRLVDTRGNGFAGPFGPPSLAAGVPRDFPLTGQCGLPPEAQAVSLNVTATTTLGPGFFLLHPGGATAPLVSTLNYLGGQTVANAALVPLGPAGLTVIAGVSGADLVLDVSGYFVVGAICPPSMVRSGPICLDKYEASVWETTDPAVIAKIRTGVATLAELQAAGAVQRGVASDDYGAGCPDTGNGCLNFSQGRSPRWIRAWISSMHGMRSPMASTT